MSVRRRWAAIAVIPTLGLLGFVDMRDERPDFATTPPPTVPSTVLDRPVEPVAAAVRVLPPTTTAPPATAPTAPPLPAFSSDSLDGACIGALPLLVALSPGWDPWRMARLAFRESRCLPHVQYPGGTATGLLQVLARVHCPWLAGLLGGCSILMLKDPVFNIRAAAELWRVQGYSAWRTT